MSLFFTLEILIRVITFKLEGLHSYRCLWMISKHSHLLNLGLHVPWPMQPCPGTMWPLVFILSSELTRWTLSSRVTQFSVISGCVWVVRLKWFLFFFVFLHFVHFWHILLNKKIFENRKKKGVSQFSWVSSMYTGGNLLLNFCFCFSPINLSLIMGGVLS